MLQFCAITGERSRVALINMLWAGLGGGDGGAAAGGGGGGAGAVGGALDDRQSALSLFLLGASLSLYLSLYLSLFSLSLSLSVCLLLAFKLAAFLTAVRLSLLSPSSTPRLRSRRPGQPIIPRQR
jgi:hypothetical protein